MSSSSSPTMIHIPSQTNDGEIMVATAGTIPTTPKDAGDSTTAPAAAAPSASATDKVMCTAANLAQLLPTGTVLAYQALSPSFTNHGKCETTNQWLTAALVIVLTASCLFFAFTDSVHGCDQKLYYGVSTWSGFNVFNFSSEEEKKRWSAEEFKRLRLRPLDFMHSFFTTVVFLTVAFSDVELQNCFFPEAGMNTQELLKNLPLGIALLSSFVFIIFPTKRKGIGFNVTTPGGSASATDKVMCTAANLAQLLPTGTTLAYQALSPSFTNYGKCETTNQWLSAALVIVLTVTCLFFAFTDSIVGRDHKLYYGVATGRGFNVFNFSSKEEKKRWSAEEFRRLRLQPLDFMHSFFTAVVFLAVAFSDVELQSCFFPDAGKNTEELLKNLPVGMALLSSFVFIIFPTERKGIGFNVTTPHKKAVPGTNSTTPTPAVHGTNSTTPTSDLEAPLISSRVFPIDGAYAL